jgi:hypothetical protein
MGKRLCERVAGTFSGRVGCRDRGGGAERPRAGAGGDVLGSYTEAANFSPRLLYGAVRSRGPSEAVDCGRRSRPAENPGESNPITGVMCPSALRVIRIFPYGNT